VYVRISGFLDELRKIQMWLPCAVSHALSGSALIQPSCPNLWTCQINAEMDNYFFGTKVAFESIERMPLKKRL
jgi:hypothetical protein